MKPKTIVLILYHLFVGTVIAANFHSGSWLMGWDGLYPELNIPLNIIRGLTAGWQEYYGAGLVGGHGFAATLPHTLIIGLFSLIIPQHLVRSVFIFLCYYLGGLGMLLVSNALIHTFAKDERVPEPKKFTPLSWYVSLVSSIYYLTNLATIQTFYVPLEAFTVHFAAFPWLTYSLMLLLAKITRKRILFFCALLLISSIQGFIPAVFAAYGVSLAMITAVYALMHRFEKKVLRSLSIVWLCVIAINAYWLAPVGYFSLTQSKDYINAYNSITTTPQFTANSIGYGTFVDTVLLKSFLWESNELGGAILTPWIAHSTIPGIMAIGYAVFGLAILGLLLGVTGHRKPLIWGLAASMLYFFGNIAIDMPPFAWIIQAIQSRSPEFAQAFRTTFTKFGVGLAFHYGLFISIGLYSLVRILSRRFTRLAIHSAVPALTAIALIIFSLPLWRGNLMYKKLFVRVPTQYIELISYVNTLPPGKIADFPQDCAEGWYNHLWGYFGSGFLWYGIQHPFMARAFDVWSHNNENYYWELSTALRKQDVAAVENVFDKYNIRYVLYDYNITHCRSQKGFLSSLDFAGYLEKSDAYTKKTTFSTENVLPIIVYERNQSTTGAVTIIDNPTNVWPPYQYHDTDAAFASTSGYISDPRKTPDVTDPDRLLFSKRGTPLLYEEMGRFIIQPVATISGAATISVPCRDTALYGPSLALRTVQGDSLRLTATNTRLCQTVTFEGIDTNKSFILSVASRHIAGQPLAISVTNKGRPTGLDILLPEHTGIGTDYYLLTPTFPSEVQLTATISHASYNRYSSINDLLSITLFSLDETRPKYPRELSRASVRQPEQVIHPISGLYIVSLPSEQSGAVLTLDQSFNKGWIAYTRDRTQIRDHILVNNWANGWRLDGKNGTVVLVFLPQFLQYLGFLLFLIPGILIFRTKT